jgi:leader peptidase (prepilin peptidase)/N-methyltransferase
MAQAALPLLVALACALLGLGVPALIAAIPEPDEPEEAKEPYTTIAVRPGLRWRAAVAAGLAGGVVGAGVGLDWPLLHLAALVPIGVALAVVDWRTRLLPTRVVAPSYALVVTGVLVTWIATRETDDLLRAGWGWLGAGGLYWLLWRIHPRGMGYGDVRLSGVLGLALGQLGWGPLLIGVYAGFLLGGVLGGLLSLTRVVERKAYPFGPFMLAGALVGVLFGDRLLAGLVTG